MSRPPQSHINAALRVERGVSEAEQDLYNECMNGKPMSQRKTDQELRDGCILTGVYRRCKLTSIEVLDEDLNYID